MRDRKADLCPSCGSKFKRIIGSDRRARIGVWRDYICLNCGTRVCELTKYPKKSD